MTDQQKQALAAFSVGVAGSDGRIEPAEVKTLTKLYPLLGFSADDVYAHLHALMSTPAAASPDGPITIQLRRPTATSFSVPPPEDVKRTMDRGVSLDMKAVQAKLRETAEVSALLSTIFVEEPALTPDSSLSEVERIGPLDNAHSELLRRLVNDGKMSRGQFEHAAAELGLLPEGALDAINDAAFEITDRPLCEGEDPICVDVEVAKEMVA
jgi:hypothetical protein